MNLWIISNNHIIIILNQKKKLFKIDQKILIYENKKSYF